MHCANLLQAITSLYDCKTLLIGAAVLFTIVFLLIFRLYRKMADKTEQPVTHSFETPPSVSPVVDGIPDEVVAVIAAAVAAMSDGTTQYAIRRIRPASARATRSVWAAAGLADNTRPF